MASSTLFNQMCTECPVCYDKYTKKVRLAITCTNEKCNYKACLSCIKTYINNNTDDVPYNCMCCKSEYTIEFMNKIFSKTFVKKLIKKKEEKKRKMVIDNIHEYSEMANNEKKIRELENELKEEKKNLSEYNCKVTKCYNLYNESLKIIDTDIEEYKNIIKEIKNKSNDLLNDDFYINIKMLYEELKRLVMVPNQVYHYCNNNGIPLPLSKHMSSKISMIAYIIAYLYNPDCITIYKEYNDICNKREKKFIEVEQKKEKIALMRKNNLTIGVNNTSKIPCIKEDCRGYLSSENRCGICDTEVCDKCMILKEDEHKCNNDDIETAKSIKENTKPCPKCNVRIYKSEGCDQMWCVNCHTTFSWTTNKINNGEVIHNPHYIELANKLNTNTDNVFSQCNTDIMPPRNLIFSTMNQQFLRPIAYKVLEIENHINHLYRLENRLEDTLNKYKSKEKMLKVNYILGDINEKKLHKSLDTNAKEINKFTNWLSINRLEKKLSIEILWYIINNISEDINTYSEILDNFKELTDMFTDTLKLHKFNKIK